MNSTPWTSENTGGGPAQRSQPLVGPAHGPWGHRSQRLLSSQPVSQRYYDVRNVSTVRTVLGRCISVLVTEFVCLFVCVCVCGGGGGGEWMEGGGRVDGGVVHASLFVCLFVCVCVCVCPCVRASVRVRARV